MKKRVHIFISILSLILLILVLLLVSGQKGCESAECHNNGDCIKVQITCCPCNMGGREACIPLSLADLYNRQLQDCPPIKELVCPAQYNCKIQNCSCIAGYCVGAK